ncbi:MAG: CoA ester lyase [Pseudomonadota bacterium]
MTEAPLYRSVLYIPASKERALEKARTLDVDAIIFDLEDAVAPDEKTAARGLLADHLTRGGFGHRKRIVRINGLDTPWGHEDARAAAEMSCDFILLPKTEDPAQISSLKSLVPRLPVWCMIETPRGVLNALSIADCDEVDGFVMGTNDLAKDLGCATGGDRMAMMTSLQMCQLAARAAGIVIVDGVYNAFKDDQGLRLECEQGFELGMDGKTLIHPSQVAIANEVFAPTEEEVVLAKRQIEAFDAATARGEGVAVLDGKIVENLHVETARAIIAKSDAVRARTAA